MKQLRDELAQAVGPVKAVRLWWLGQAGFAFKNPAGTVVFVDPYLSDAVERLHGFKRLSLAPLEPAEAAPDLVVLTHEHTDHLDPDLLTLVGKTCPACRFAAPVGCEEGLRQAGIARERWTVLEPGKKAVVCGIHLYTAPADHGGFSPTACSVLLDFNGLRILCTGDTSWRPDYLQALLGAPVDVLLPCINGVFGNMNHIDAAMLVKQVAPRLAIPCHFWMFAEAGAGDPAGFLHACRSFAPEVEARLLRPGEGLTIQEKS